MSSDVTPLAKTVVFATRKGRVRAVVPADATVWRTKLEELLDEDVWPCTDDEPWSSGPEDVVIVDTAIAERGELGDGWVSNIQEPVRGS